MSKSQRAGNLLRDEFFTGEMSALEQMNMDYIINSSPEDIDGRENAYKQIQAIRMIMAHFESLSKEDEMKKRAWKIL